jgi:putative hemolysin
MINNILRFFGVSSDGEGKVSEEELRLIIMGARQSGGIEKVEAKMVEGVLDLQDMRVSEVMKPRINVEALDANATLTHFLHVVNKTKYSRFPVFEGEIDHIVGVAIAKDLLGVEASSFDTTRVREIMEPTYFVPESMRVQMVLEEMRRRRLHMAIVVDEYGGTAGVVTLEDILEEVVGEIYDEGDSEVPWGRAMGWGGAGAGGGR